MARLSRVFDRAEEYAARDIPREGRFTRQIERQTGRVPSLVYLGLAAASMGASAVFMARKRKEEANFIGLWAPAILLMGIYNKLVKQD